MLGSREQELTQGASIMNAAESLTLSHTPNETTGEPIDSEELTTMIQNRIEELETATTTLLVDADERDIINSIKKANREMTQLIRAQGDQSEKLGILHRKYMELFQDMKRLEKEHTKLKKREDIIIREKDAARNDMTRAISVKSKLENLCRELQRENRRIKEESNLLVLKEQQEREELNLKFHSALWDIKTKPDEELYHDHQGQSDEAKKLREKLRNFMRQYDLREIHFERVMRSKDIELQLYEAKIAQQRQVAEQESVRASSLRNQVETFVKTETELRKQLGVYVEKFRQVEETLNKSNELFSTFRREMEQMTKKTKRLEKENNTLRVKTDTMNRNIIEMAEECNRAQKLLSTSEKKRQKLEDLCRALQMERNTLKRRVEYLERDHDDCFSCASTEPDGEPDEEALSSTTASTNNNTTTKTSNANKSSTDKAATGGQSRPRGAAK